MQKFLPDFYPCNHIFNKKILMFTFPSNGIFQNIFNKFENTFPETKILGAEKRKIHIY